MHEISAPHTLTRFSFLIIILTHAETTPSPLRKTHSRQRRARLALVGGEFATLNTMMMINTNFLTFRVNY